jgi:ribosomal protein S18 acetylase RimI-like enzyme
MILTQDVHWARRWRDGDASGGRMTEIVTLPHDETQIEAAGRLLAGAFMDDPLQNYVFPDPKERAQRSAAQFATLVRHDVLVGEVLATADMTGVSAWMPPGKVVTFEDASRAGFPQLPVLMGKAAFERLGGVLDYLSDVHQKGMPAEHWYLSIIGVRPDQRGRGQGEALLAPIMRRAAMAGVPICLDTAQPKVRALYERLGFRVLVETVDPTSGLRFWTYQRGPD